MSYLMKKVFATFNEKQKRRNNNSAVHGNHDHAETADNSGNHPPEFLLEDGSEMSVDSHDSHSPSKSNVKSKPSDDDNENMMEDWNPMADAYNDPTFNSYLRGPGAALPLNSHVRGTHKGYVKLYVSNVPKNLSQLAMHHIFSNFGKPVSINIKSGGTGPGYGKYSADTTYAFVAYATLIEAKEAMMGLDGKEPYKLRISFANESKDKTEKDAIRKFPNFLSDDSQSSESVVIPQSFWDIPSEKPPSIILGKPPSHFHPETSARDELNRDEMYEQGIFGTFIVPRAVFLHNRNMLSWEAKRKREIENVSKPQVPSKVQEIGPGEVKVLRRNISEKKLELLRALGKCVVCGGIPFVKCSCGALYCCNTHLELDGESHEPLCQRPVVNSTGRNEVSAGNLNKTREKPASFDELNPEFSSRYSFLKLDGEAADFNEPKPVFECGKIWQLASAILNRSDITHVPTDEDFFVIPSPNSAERLPDDGLPQPPGVAELAATIVSFCPDPDTLENEECWMPDDDFTEVTVVHREGPGDFWVLTKYGIRQLLEFLSILNERSPIKGSVVSQLGRTFGYHHNGNWCRIAFTSYTPYTGFLIDYGYSIEIDPKNLLPLSPKMEGFPPLAVRIRLTDNSSTEFLNKKVNDSLEVKALTTLSNGAILVSPNMRIDSANIPAVELPLRGHCFLTAFHTPQVIYVRPLSTKATKIFDLVIQDVAAHCWIAAPMDTLPNIGEVIGARYAGDNNNFHRALVMGTEGDKSDVIFLDFGYIDKVSLIDLRRLPDAFKKIPATAIKVGLKDVNYRLFNDFAWIKLRSVEEEKQEDNVTLEHDGDLSCVKLVCFNTLFNEELNEVLLPSHVSASNVLRDYFDLTDILWDSWEKSVKLEGAVTNILDYNKFCYIHYSQGFDYVKEVMTPLITKHCESLNFTQYVPRLNEFVLVKHADDWYRAFCDIDPRNPFTAQVFFVDYGNTGEVPVEDIRPMAPEFASVPATAKQCVVEGLPSRDAFQDHHDLLKSLFEQVKELVVLPRSDDNPMECKVYVPSLTKPLAELDLPEKTVTMAGSGH